MPKYHVVNTYYASVIHEVEAKDRDEALDIGRDMEDDPEELKDSLQYDESHLVSMSGQVEEDEGPEGSNGDA